MKNQTPASAVFPQVVAFGAADAGKLAVARAYTRDDPALVYLDALLERTPYFENAAIRARRQFFLALDGNDRPLAVAAADQLVFVSSGSPIAMNALGRAAARHLDATPRAVCGPTEAFEHWCAGYEQIRALPTPLRRLEHRVYLWDQPQSTLTAADLAGHLNLAQAGPEDGEFIAAGQRELAARELGYDPQARPGFIDELERQIQAGRWWLGRIATQRCFIAMRGAQNAATLRLENIWVPRELRGRGIGGAALARLGASLFTGCRTISLTVRPENTAAIRLYEKLGFEARGRQTTDFFSGT